jgi:chemotaxis protein methyltransferase CheR
MIHVSHSNGIKKILVDGTVSSYEDLLRIQQELEITTFYKKFDLSLIDIESLPAAVVKSIYRLKGSIEITTTSRSLWVYLSKLGIKNKLKSGFDIKVSNTRDMVRAIAIGGSAGSIEQILKILDTLPYIDISIFIVVHILPNKKSNLAKIFAYRTNYKVCEAQHNMYVEKNTIYIAPPDYHMIVVDGIIFLDQSEHVSYSRPSINVTFESLGLEYSNSLIAILLCGYGADGVSSLESLSKINSEIIVESPKDCEAKEMPLSAIKKHYYTKVLSTDQITSYLNSILRVGLNIDDEIDSFLENISIVYGYDFTNYDKSSITRRIYLIMQQSMITNFKEFEQAVFRDRQLFIKLLNSFSINVTTFFRNPSVFHTVRKEVVSYLSTYPSIRVWCAGCSRGDEPYSVAIMLDEMGLLDKSLIYATDFNARVLNEATNGLYPLVEYKEFEKNYLKSGGRKELSRWFEKNSSFVEVSERIKKKVVFFKHNLVTDGSINEFNMVFCRNVLIYFDKELQTKVFDTIDSSLDRGGFLVLGDSEILPYRYGYDTVGKNKNKIYKKKRKIEIV